MTDKENKQEKEAKKAWLYRMMIAGHAINGALVNEGTSIEKVVEIFKEHYSEPLNYDIDLIIDGSIVKRWNVKKGKITLIYDKNKSFELQE